MVMEPSYNYEENEYKRNIPKAKPIRLVRSSLVVTSVTYPKQPASKVAVCPNTPITDLDDISSL